MTFHPRRVIGPDSRTDKAVLRFDGTTSNLAQDTPNVTYDNSQLTVIGDTVITGNLTVDGYQVTTQGENVLYADNHLYLNAGYTTTSPQTGGLVVNYLPTSAFTVVENEYVAGVQGVYNPYVFTDGYETFAANDFIQISLANADGYNEGLYEVLNHDGYILTIRGIGTDATIEDFTQNQFNDIATDGARITKVNVSIIRTGTDGIWESAFGSAAGLTFTDFGAGSGGVTGGGSNDQLAVWSSGTSIDGSTALTFNGTTFGVDAAAVFNNSEANVDFRVAGDTETNLFFVDASADAVGIGTSTPAGKFNISTSGADDADLAVGATGTGRAALFLDASNGDFLGGDYVTIQQSNDLSAAIHNFGGTLALGSSGTLGTEQLAITSTEFVVNEQGADYDFRVEGDAATHLLFVDAQTDHVQIRGPTATAPAAALIGGADMLTTMDNTWAGYNSISSSGTPTTTNFLQGARTRGTLDAPTAVISGDYIWSHYGAGYDGSALQTTGSIHWLVDGTVAAGTVPMALLFETGATNTASRTERMRITSAGDIGFGTAGDPEVDLELSRDGLAQIRTSSFGTSPGASFYMFAGDGTRASPTAIDNNDLIGQIAWGGVWGTSLAQSTAGATLTVTATENWNSTNTGIAMTFDTVVNGSNTRAERMRIHSDGNVGIGAADPLTNLEVSSDSSGNLLRASRFGGNTAGPIIEMFAADGTRAAPTAIDSGDQLGRIRWSGVWDNTLGEFNVGAAIDSFATENWSVSATGSDIRFSTVANTTNSLAERMRISDAGHVLPGADNAYNFGSESLYWADGYFAGLNVAGSPITPLSGTDGYIAYFNGTTAIEADTTNIFYWDDLNGRLGIGTDRPDGIIQLDIANVFPDPAFIGSADHFIMSNNDFTAMKMITASGTVSTSPFIASARSRGTLEVPTSVADGDLVFCLEGHGYDGTVRQETASIYFEVDGAVAGNQVPQSIVFQTGATTTASRAERMRIDPSGNVGVGTDAPTSTFDVDGSMSVAVTTITTSTSIAASHHVVLVDASSAEVTVTLPAVATTTGRKYYIKKIDSSSNNVVVDGQSSETIDGETTQTISLQYESLTIVNDGSEWFII